MQNKYICVLIHILTKDEAGAPLNRTKPSSKIFCPDCSKAVILLWIIYVISVLFCYAFMHVCLLMPCGYLWKGLTSWLSFVMSNCAVVIFSFVSWVRCGA